MGPSRLVTVMMLWSRVSVCDDETAGEGSDAVACCAAIETVEIEEIEIGEKQKAKSGRRHGQEGQSQVPY